MVGENLVDGAKNGSVLGDAYLSLSMGYLNKFGCKFVDNLEEGKGYILEFKSEEDAVEFILKCG